MPLLPDDPRQQRKLGIALLPLVLLFGYWYFFHGGRVEEITAMETRLETLETQNATAMARAQQGGPELADRVELYEEHILRLETLVPREEEVAELLHDMTLRAQENGVEMARMRPAEAEPTSFYTLQQYEISVYGSYHDLGRFLASIGSLPRIVTPFQVGMSSRNESYQDGRPKLQADFRIKTYVQPAVAPVEEAAGAST